MPRIARALEERFPETWDMEPELLAQHYTEAGLTEQAVEDWHRAGQQALARSAVAEAVAHLTEGLKVLQGLPSGTERQRRELGLQLALGQASIAGKGFAATETGRRLRPGSRTVPRTRRCPGGLPRSLRALRLPSSNAASCRRRTRLRASCCTLARNGAMLLRR